MADSGLYDSNSDVSSLYDGSSSENESWNGSERPAERNPEWQDDVNHGADEQARTASQATKAIEAAGERSPVLSPEDAVEGISRHPYASATRHGAWENDLPILDAGPAPPDYFAATAWRRFSPGNTVETHGIALPRQQGQQDLEVQSGEDEANLSHRRLSQTEPRTDNVESQEGHRTESLEEPVLDETVPLLSPSYMNAKESKRNRIRAVCLCTKRQWCVLSAVFIAVLILTATLTVWPRDYKTSEIPKHANRHGDPALDHPGTAECKFDSYSSYIDIPFEDPVSFAIFEDIDFVDQPELKDTLVTGNVEVIYVPQNSSVVLYSPIVIRVHMATVLPWKVEVVENSTYRKGKDEIAFLRPNLQRPSGTNAHFHSGTSPPCFDVMILVYVREGTVLERWVTSLFSLNFVDHEAAIHESTGPSAKMMPGNAGLFVANKTECTLSSAKSISATGAPTTPT